MKSLSVLVATLALAIACSNPSPTVSPTYTPIPTPTVTPLPTATPVPKTLIGMKLISVKGLYGLVLAYDTDANGTPDLCELHWATSQNSGGWYRMEELERRDCYESVRETSGAMFSQ